MAVSPTHPRPRAVLKALIEEARRRARKRRLIYAAAATTLLLTIAVVLALTGDSGRISDHAQPSPATSAPAHLALQRAPYIGVSCRTPNSIACDRVGLAIWLRRPVARLTATINSRTVAMGLPCGSARYRETCSSYCRHVARDQPCGTYFEGFLRPAGLLDGPLRVKPDRGRYYWIGKHDTVGTVRLLATYRDGETATVTKRVRVSAGWG
jgi:hypothetical protein